MAPQRYISSQSGVQQGDPLGPMLFAVVLRKLVSSIEADDGCFDLSLNLWYLDDGVLAGERTAVVRALHLIEELQQAVSHFNAQVSPQPRDRLLRPYSYLSVAREFF